MVHSESRAPKCELGISRDVATLRFVPRGSGEVLIPQIGAGFHIVRLRAEWHILLETPDLDLLTVANRLVDTGYRLRPTMLVVELLRHARRARASGENEKAHQGRLASR